MSSSRKLLVLAILGFNPLYLSAADADCLDVLVHAPYDVADYRHESFVFMDRASTKTERDHLDTSGAGGMNIDGVPIQASDNHNADRQLSESHRFQFQSTDRESFLTYSGQSKILDTWATCMVSQGGIRLRFEPNGANGDANDVVLHIRYFPAVVEGRELEQPDFRLFQRVAIPNAKSVSDPNNCLEPTTVYRAGKGACDVQIKTFSPWDSFSISLPFRDPKDNPVSASAFLPVRATIKATSKPWPSNQADGMLHAHAETSAGEQSATVRKTVKADAGFFILHKINTSRSGNTSDCTVKAELDENDGTSATLETRIFYAGGIDLHCYGHFSGTQVQLSWEPLK
ncbi:hypothetical protein ABIF65_008190 [Bradyrhizobium japonicum]